jgi:hypothetical protein
VLAMPEAASRGDDPVQDVEISLHRHEQYDGLQGFLSVAGKCSVDSQEIADLRRPGHRVIDLASIGFGADAVTSRAAESPGLCMLSARSGALIDTPVTVPQFARSRALVRPASTGSGEGTTPRSSRSPSPRCESPSPSTRRACCGRPAAVRHGTRSTAALPRSRSREMPIKASCRDRLSPASSPAEIVASATLWRRWVGQGAKPADLHVICRRPAPHVLPMHLDVRRPLSRSPSRPSVPSCRSLGPTTDGRLVRFASGIRE